MMDRWLLPEDGGNGEAGKEVMRQIVAASKGRLEQMRQACEQAGDTHGGSGSMNA